MKTLKNLIIPLAFVFGMSGNALSQEVPKDYYIYNIKVPENYSKADTIVKDDKTTITLYDSLKSYTYKKIIDPDFTTIRSRTYTPLKHKKKIFIMINYNDFGEKVFELKNVNQYDEKENKKVYSTTRSFEGKYHLKRLYNIKKMQYDKKGRLIKELSEDHLYFKNEDKYIKSFYKYLDNGNIEEISYIKIFEDKKLKNKKKTIQLYDSKGNIIN